MPRFGDYRVNYGNGQVSDSMTQAAAHRHLADQGDTWGYIEFWDGYDWFRMRERGRK